MDTQQYRELTVGEVIQEGDEWRFKDDAEWKAATDTIGETYAPTPCAPTHSYHCEHRRPVMSHRPADLPNDLPDPPEPPKGTRWVWRGHGFETSGKNPCDYIYDYPLVWYRHKYGYRLDRPIRGKYSVIEAMPIEPAKEIWSFFSQSDTSQLHPENQALKARVKELEQKLENIRAAVAQR